MAEKISKVSVSMKGLLETIAEAVQEWKPTERSKEIQYSAALADYLRDVCPPDTRIETEYRDGGTTVDVWLAWQGYLLSDQIFIELKRNLKRKTDCDRLVGQIVTLKPGERNILVVLVGDTSAELYDRLTEQFQDELDEYTGSVRIVTIGPMPNEPTD